LFRIEYESEGCKNIIQLVTKGIVLKGELLTATLLVLF